MLKLVLSLRDVLPPNATSRYEAPVSGGPRKWWRELSKACQHAFGLASEPAPTSGYLTLIPLSGGHLQVWSGAACGRAEAAGACLLVWKSLPITS